jgi:hypothetical protein
MLAVPPRLRLCGVSMPPGSGPWAGTSTSPWTWLEGPHDWLTGASLQGFDFGY